MADELEDDEEVMTPEEFHATSAEWIARGPFRAIPEEHRWKDFLGKLRRKTEFAVRDAVGGKVGAAADQAQAERWAQELTANGYIEE